VEGNDKMRYAKLFFLLVWLFSYCPSAKAETERQSPDTLKTQTNLEGTITAIQDDPDSPDGNWLVNIIIDENTICRVSFPTPTGNNFRYGLEELQQEVHLQLLQLE